jgi:hypothetical protein
VRWHFEFFSSIRCGGDQKTLASAGTWNLLDLLSPFACLPALSRRRRPHPRLDGGAVDTEVVTPNGRAYDIANEIAPGWSTPGTETPAYATVRTAAHPSRWARSFRRKAAMLISHMMSPASALQGQSRGRRQKDKCRNKPV